MKKGLSPTFTVELSPLGKREMEFRSVEALGDEHLAREKTMSAAVLRTAADHQLACSQDWSARVPFRSARRFPEFSPPGAYWLA